MKKILVSILSPCGGVGKSTISKELASIIASTKLDASHIKTCLVDGNLTCGCQTTYFGIANVKYNIGDWLVDYRDRITKYSQNDIYDCYSWNYIEKYFSYIQERHLYLLPAPPCGTRIDMSTSEANLIFNKLLEHFDVVIVDTPNDISNITRAAIELSDKALFVVNDDERSMSGMTRMRGTITSLSLNERMASRAGIIFNRYHKKSSERYCEAWEVEERIKYPVVACIPQFDNMWALNNSKLLASFAKSNPMRKPLYDLANLIVPEVKI